MNAKTGMKVLLIWASLPLVLTAVAQQFDSYDYAEPGKEYCDSHHPELVNAPYATTGFSAGGRFASTLLTNGVDHEYVDRLDPVSSIRAQGFVLESERERLGRGSCVAFRVVPVK
jgi:hypothetical protein